MVNRNEFLLNEYRKRNILDDIIQPGEEILNEQEGLINPTDIPLRKPEITPEEVPLPVEPIVTTPPVNIQNKDEAIDNEKKASDLLAQWTTEMNRKPESVTGELQKRLDEYKALKQQDAANMRDFNKMRGYSSIANTILNAGQSASRAFGTKGVKDFDTTEAMIAPIATDKTDIENQIQLAKIKQDENKDFRANRLAVLKSKLDETKRQNDRFKYFSTVDGIKKVDTITGETTNVSETKNRFVKDNMGRLVRASDYDDSVNNKEKPKQLTYADLDVVDKKAVDPIRKNYLKQQEAIAAELGDVSYMEEQIKANIPGMRDTIQNLFARKIGGEKGVMTDKDFDRAAGTPGLAAWMRQSVQGLQNRSMTPEVQKAYLKAIDVIKKVKGNLKNIALDRQLEQLRGSLSVGRDYDDESLGTVLTGINYNTIKTNKTPEEIFNASNLDENKKDEEDLVTLQKTDGRKVKISRTDPRYKELLKLPGVTEVKE